MHLRHGAYGLSVRKHSPSLAIGLLSVHKTISEPRSHPHPRPLHCPDLTACLVLAPNKAPLAIKSYLPYLSAPDALATGQAAVAGGALRPPSGSYHIIASC